MKKKYIGHLTEKVFSDQRESLQKSLELVLNKSRKFIWNLNLWGTISVISSERFDFLAWRHFVGSFPVCEAGNQKWLILARPPIAPRGERFAVVDKIGISNDAKAPTVDGHLSISVVVHVADANARQASHVTLFIIAYDKRDWVPLN